MESEEHLVTTNTHLYEPDSLYSVHAISKFDKYDYNSQVETNALCQEQGIVIEQMVLLFLANLCSSSSINAYP